MSIRTETTNEVILLLSYRVANGIALLNKVAPHEWYNQTGLNGLDMSHEQNCVLAQLAQNLADDGKADFHDSLRLLGITQNDCYEYGFDLSAWDTEGYHLLTEIWLREIKKLRGEE